MDQYIELIENKKYNNLSNISFISELVEKKYQDKYLIEYLLEQGIHSEKMDIYLKYHESFLPFYLKYNILKPILNCSLKVLFQKINGNLYFDLILDKLNDKDKIELYYNIRKSSYNDFHHKEREIIDIYLRHGIILPIMFVTTKLDIKDEVFFEDNLILEFKEVFKDTDTNLLNFIVNELKRSFLTNQIRTKKDIKKLIDFKKNNPNFIFKDSKTLEGSFDLAALTLGANTKDPLVFNHELSHLLYQGVENKELIDSYEEIRKKIDTNEYFLLIKKKMIVFHEKFLELNNTLDKLYDNKIIEFYGSLEKYIEKIYIDMKENTPEYLEIKDIETGNTSVPFITDVNLKDIALTFIESEKKEFIFKETRRIFSPYLMMENLVDSILKGKLFDDISFHCLSGHSSLYFEKEPTNSFDECLANYDAIKKSNDGSKIIKDLKNIVGDEIIIFLDQYIEKNREGKHGKR